MTEDKATNKQNTTDGSQDSLPLFFSEESSKGKQQPTADKNTEPTVLKLSVDANAPEANNTVSTDEKPQERQKAPVKLVQAKGKDAPVVKAKAIIAGKTKSDAKPAEESSNPEEPEKKQSSVADNKPQEQPEATKAKAVTPVKVTAKVKAKAPVKAKAKKVTPDKQPSAEKETKTPANAKEIANEPEISSDKAPQAGKKKNVHIVGNISSDSVTIGQILQDARVSYDLSLNQVEQITKIKKSFIEALERDDYSTLPPLVYISAYVKTLCELYELGSDETAEILKRLKEKNSKSPISEEIIHHLEEEKQINHDEELKVKRYFIVSIAAIVLLIIAGVIVFMVYFTGPKPGTTENGQKAPAATVQAAVKPVTDKQIKTLLAPQMPTMTELEIPVSNQ